MPTANELFRDALLRRQMALAKFERGLQGDILKLLDVTERDLRITLTDRLTALEGKDFGPTVNSRLNVLMNAISKIRGTAFDGAGSAWDSAMQDLAVAEAEYVNANFKDVMPVHVETVLPATETLRALVDLQPVHGRLMEEWTQGLGDADTQRIMDAVRVGMAQGDTTQNIIRRVVGTSQIDGVDGVLEIARRDAAAVTQSAIATFSNAARAEFFNANSDIFASEAWVATLDSVTCPECGALDGQQFEVGKGPQAPAHFFCRCVRVAVISPHGLVGNRPSNAASEDALDGLSGKARADKIAELVGQVPASTTYSEWLASQTSAFQEHTLGPARAKLFSAGGLKLDKFVNVHGDNFNLAALRKLEPAAFKRAGL